jgi:hypothetical protein
MPAYIFRFGPIACVLLASLWPAGCTSDSPDAQTKGTVKAVATSSSAGAAGTPSPTGAGGTPSLTDADAAHCTPNSSEPVPSDRCTEAAANGGDVPACGRWLKVEPEGAQCSDGSPYKFFVNYSNTSNNLVVMFEPGGACWDYASCSGGTRGAANPHGIPDEHMSEYQYLNLVRRSADNPLHDWNMVFVSYCTGDVHAGDRVAEYADPAGGAPLTYRHVGYRNTTKVVDWLAEHFKSVPKLFVTGCSAGGVGALNNYQRIRQGLSGAQCGYLLDDSGPAFHSDGPSKQLHERIREAWNLDTLLESEAEGLPVTADELVADYGLLNTALADAYPKDRLSVVLYRMDLNYSLYSYQSFDANASEADIHAKWWQDTQELIETYKSRRNLAYYIPYFRSDNCSHCVSIPPLGHDTATILGMPWLGSEIQSDHLELRDFVVTLIDDTAPLKSYLEDEQPGEAFTDEQSQMCLKDD